MPVPEGVDGEHGMDTRGVRGGRGRRGWCRVRGGGGVWGGQSGSECGGKPAEACRIVKERLDVNGSGAAIESAEEVGVVVGS